jgi:hypothetical protein
MAKPHHGLPRMIVARSEKLIGESDRDFQILYDVGVSGDVPIHFFEYQDWNLTNGALIDHQERRLGPDDAENRLGISRRSSKGKHMWNQPIRSGHMPPRLKHPPIGACAFSWF